MPDSTRIQRDRQHKSLARSVFRFFLDSGTQALVLHQAAHFFYKLGVPLVPAMIRRINISFTGADIHPAAEIDKGLGVYSFCWKYKAQLVRELELNPAAKFLAEF